MAGVPYNSERDAPALSTHMTCAGAHRTLHCPSRCQLHYDNFRRNAEAHGNDARSDSPADEHMPSVLDDVTHRIPLTESGRHDRPTDDGEVDLPAVGMSGQR